MLIKKTKKLDGGNRESIPPLRQVGNVWHGRGSPALGSALNPGPLSPAEDSLCPNALLVAPLKWTGMPE